jgi:hypothetical protein
MSSNTRICLLISFVTSGKSTGRLFTNVKHLSLEERTVVLSTTLISMTTSQPTVFRQVQIQTEMSWLFLHLDGMSKVGRGYSKVIYKAVLRTVST